MIVISFWSILLSSLSALWSIFIYWLSIFASPFSEPEMFWIIIPVWVNWFFTEFFMEKHGTSFGNAVGNGVIPILASLDWTRYLYRLLNERAISFTFPVFLKFMLTVFVFAYGVFVIIAGIRIRRIVFYVGRIRWITYALVMFTPIIYNVQKMDLYTLSAIVLFFPVYYWVIEIFDRITPEPRVYSES